MEVTKISDAGGRTLGYQVTWPDGTQVMYNRFKGGFSWPMNEDALIVVMGEVKTNHSTQGMFPLHVMEEYYTGRLSHLREHCAVLQERWHIREWLARISGIDPGYPDAFYEHFDRKGIGTNLIEPTLKDFNLACHRMTDRFGYNLLKVSEELADYIDSVLKADMDPMERNADFHPQFMAVAGVEFDFSENPYSPPKELKVRRVPPSPWAV